MAAIDATQLTPDLLALPVQVNKFTGADAGEIEGGKQTDLGEFADGDRKRVDPDAEFSYL